MCTIAQQTAVRAAAWEQQEALEKDLNPRPGRGEPDSTPARGTGVGGLGAQVLEWGSGSRPRPAPRPRPIPRPRPVPRPRRAECCARCSCRTPGPLLWAVGSCTPLYPPHSGHPHLGQCPLQHANLMALPPQVWQDRSGRPVALGAWGRVGSSYLSHRWAP